ncbi:MAG: alpha/beta hydrolase [Bacteroidales bacterium]|nr:alpha/beta hydrolase [Bacteroidales bacterium]MBN2762981.1 alpha/beta hydrolase [Bacteroidales bacterium]
MDHQIKFRQKTLHAVSEGEGIPLLLLHGYLESLRIWDSFAGLLKHHYKVIRMDLPGHGQSDVIAPVHTMELMAESVSAVLNALAIDACILVGHSMGGYVTLAAAEKTDRRLLGFCLFHAAPFADNDEKKASRDKEIDLVRNGKKDLIINTNIPKGFADDNLEKFRAEVEMARQIALGTSDAGIIAALQGMKQRHDRSAIILQSPVPVLWILGQKDNYIDYHKIKDKICLNPKGQLLKLENAGHMGFIEESQKALKGIMSFFGTDS